ncbi:ATP-binding cassette domain-containing protein [Paracoccus sp. YIM 132242]|uniref:ATP-binding cassette domain-containing protein n=1 Tax=Paracoccus lichenicola TaxID=2665644 RepID=A0A6L6HTT5_9RHOB|nr:ABC transporter ATP-binding protein [Paracoccus lichenicola]MTE01651.1 ATP-binding cassette domain-containing protein [Paracoccus lichenicola]
MTVERNSGPLLRLENVVQKFGGLVAVNNVSFEIRKGEVKGLIGPNGAGKSTTFDLVTGVRPPTSGEIHFNGIRVTRQPAHTRSPMGMARTFQIVRLFRGLSVLENVQMGMHPAFPDGLLPSILRSAERRRQEAESRKRAMKLLDFVGLADRAGERIETLTLGQLRLVDIARALASGPDLLMLDEPAAGLNDAETRNLAEMLALLKKRGMSMLLVEHDIDFIMSACDTVVVMDHGTKIADGTPAEVSRNREVIAAYIGRRAADVTV